MSRPFQLYFGGCYILKNLKRTPIYEEYQHFGAKTVDFGGWELPVQFGGINT